jgi:hypothetical protein
MHGHGNWGYASPIFADLKLADISSKVTGTIERDGHEHVESMKTKNIVKPATYDGKGPWLDYKSHFDACSLPSFS